MFNDNFDSIMERMLERIPDKYDKRETSLIYQSVAMVVPELLQLQTEIESVDREAYPDSCNHYNLLRMCALKNKYPYPATQGIVVGKFNKTIEIGTSFRTEYRGYVVIEKIKNDDDGLEAYRMLAKDEGYIEVIGDLIPDEDIPGLKVAFIDRIEENGKEEEETEHLRERYLKSLQYDTFGGNIVDYKEKVLGLEGVGGVNVFRAENAKANDWNIVIVIIGSDYGVAPALTISKVEDALKGINTGTEEYDLDSGYGLAPIGHFVTVESAKEVTVNVATTLVLKDVDTVEEDVKKVIDEYLREVRTKFGENINPEIIRISQIENRILEIEGVVDVYDTKINGQQRNLNLTKYQIPRLGSVKYDIK